jgi:hypothetical protein
MFKLCTYLQAAHQTVRTLKLDREPAVGIEDVAVLDRRVRVGVNLILTKMHLMVHSVFEGAGLNRNVSVGVLFQS